MRHHTPAVRLQLHTPCAKGVNIMGRPIKLLSRLPEIVVRAQCHVAIDDLSFD